MSPPTGGESRACAERSLSTANPTAPLVSIVLCTYNGERFLAAQLDSLLAQDHTRLEILVFDDASCDGTWAILMACAAADARVHIHRNPRNLGHKRNFEQALAACSGDFIAPCDQDDLWMPGKISRLLAVAGRYSAVYCDSLLIDESGRSLDKRLSQLLHRYSGHDPAVFVFFNCASGHAMLLTRETVARALPFPDVEAHDWWLAFVATSLDGIAYHDEVLVHYRRHAGAVTHLGRTRLQRQLRDKRAEYQSNKRHLAALRTFRSAHQRYFEDLFDAWAGRARKFWSGSLFLLLFQRRRSIFFIRDSGRFLRLKKMFAHARGV